MDKIRKYLYYILIGSISFVCLTVFPMLDNSFKAETNFPQSTYGWFVWAITKSALCLLNVIIFHCFLKQGDENTKEHPNRKEAEKILGKNVATRKEYEAKSPKAFYTYEYSKKIPTLLLTTVLSLVTFVPVLTSFDLGTFTTYLFTIFLAIIFGILEMLKIEEYYTVEFLVYAKQQEEKEKEQIECKQSKPARAMNFETKYLGRNEKC